MDGIAWCLQVVSRYPVVDTAARIGRMCFGGSPRHGSDTVSVKGSAGSHDSSPDLRLDKKLILTRDHRCDVGPAATGVGAFIHNPVPSPFVSVTGLVLPITLRRGGFNNGDCGSGIQHNCGCDGSLVLGGRRSPCAPTPRAPTAALLPTGAPAQPGAPCCVRVMASSAAAPETRILR